MTDQPTTTEEPPVEEKDLTVYIESGLTEEGTYFVGFRCGDAAWALGRMDAQLYAIGVLQLVQRAEYDSAVMRLLVEKLGVELDHAAAFVGIDFRKERTPVKCADAVRLGFVGGVSKDRFRPFLTVLLDGEAMGQWELGPARDHALTVIELCEAVELDQALKKLLTGPMGLEELQAQAVVYDLQNWRWGRPPGEMPHAEPDPVDA